MRLPQPEPEIDRKVFNSERHVDAFFAQLHLCPRTKVQSVKLSTGLTVEFIIISSDEQHPHEDQQQEQQEQETRVIIVPGFLDCKEMWCYLVHFLLEAAAASATTATATTTPKVKVLLYDNRGAGHSEAPFGMYSTKQMAQDALALMDYVGWPTAHVIGGSMGGMISMELASLAPDRVQSLTLMATTRGRYLPPLPNVRAIFKVLTATEPEDKLAAMLPNQFPESFLESSMVDSSKSVRQVLAEIFVRITEEKLAVPCGLSGFVGQACAIFGHFVSDARLEVIREQGFPILIVGAAQDKMIPCHHTEVLIQRLFGEQVRHVVYDDAGHGLFFQYGEDIMHRVWQMIHRQAKASSGQTQQGENAHAIGITVEIASDSRVKKQL